MSASLLLKARSHISPSALVTNTNTMLVTHLIYLTFKATSLQIFLVCFLYSKICHCSLLQCFLLRRLDVCDIKRGIEKVWDNQSHRVYELFKFCLLVLGDAVKHLGLWNLYYKFHFSCLYTQFLCCNNFLVILLMQCIKNL